MQFLEHDLILALLLRCYLTSPFLTPYNRFEENTAFNTNIVNWNTHSLQIFDRMFFDATSFDQDLCWKFLPEQEITSTAVFCETEGGFDKNCVDKTIIYDSERRCIGGFESIIKSFTDFFDEVVGWFEDCIAFFEGLGCFAPDATAAVENIGWVPMKDLQVGDKVLTSSGRYQPIYSMFHSSATKETPYLQIHTSKSENATDMRPLELTANHMLQVAGYGNAIPAWQVKVGDFIYVMDNDEIQKSLPMSTIQQQSFRPARVNEIQKVIRNGLYNPLTPDGTIVVEGIVASAYASPLGTEHVQLFRRDSHSSVAATMDAMNTVKDGWKVMAYQDFAHILLSPYRAMCLYISMDLCQPSPHNNGESDSEGWEWHRRVGHLLLRVWLHQHVVVQALVFGVLVGIFGILNIVLSPTGLSMVLAYLSSRILYRSSKIVDTTATSRQQ